VKKIFVGSLPSTATEQEVTELFSQYGKVRSIKLATDLFSNQCKGFGFIEMEGHEARAAIAALDGSEFNGKHLRVNFENPRNRRR
jgi:RNA recognition motif-containing protein